MPTTDGRLWLASGALVLFQVWALSCGDDGNDVHAGGDAGCLPPLPTDCSTAFEPPSFGAIYENVLRKSCASAATGSACHAEAGAQLGLVLEGEQQAYDELLGHSDGRARVVPGSPECSELVRRVESDDPAVRMPVGPQKLTEGERCAIRRWIAEGAEP